MLLLICICSVALAVAAAVRIHHATANGGAPSLTEDPDVAPWAAAAQAPPPLVEPPPAVPLTAAAAPPTGPPAGATVRVVFLGDSVAKTAASAMDALAPAYGISIDNRGILGCGVVRTTPFRYFGKLYDDVPAGCETWPEIWKEAVEQDRPDVAVVLVGRWELMDRVIGGQWSSIGNPAYDADVASSLDTAVAMAAATGGRVVLATTPYYRRGLRPDGGTWPEDDPARVDRFNTLLREAAGRHPSVTVVELGNLLSVDGQLAMTINGTRVRTDGVHVAPDAGRLLAPWLLPQLRTIAGR